MVAVMQQLTESFTLSLPPTHINPSLLVITAAVDMAHGDENEVQVAKIDFTRDEGGETPLPGQVPRTYDDDEVETTFKNGSHAKAEEDRIQLQEETGLNYNYGNQQLRTYM